MMKRRYRLSEELPEPEILPMMNVLFMLVMVLMGMSAFLPMGIIHVDSTSNHAEEGGDLKQETVPALNLTILVTPTTFEIQSVAVHSTIQKQGDDYDWKALQEILIKLKRSYPMERSFTLSASENIPYEILIQLMDISRQSPEGSLLFDQVAFAPPIN